MKQLPVFFIMLTLVVSCSQNAVTLQTPDIIPYPQSVVMGNGTFSVAGATVEVDSDLDSLSVDYVEAFSEHLQGITGVPEGTSRNRICFSFDDSRSFSGKSIFDKDAQSYSIEITRRRVTVRAGSLNGFIYAIQTIRQMLPVEVYAADAATDADWVLPCGTIEDTPRFGYRGMLLDVSRYFSPVEEVKKFIDMMEISKMNVFHWHRHRRSGLEDRDKEIP